MPTERSKIKRIPKRARYDLEDIYAILDREFLCHVGFVHHGAPVVIPTLYGRSGNSIFIHGASVSRLIEDLENGIEVSVSVAKVNGLVMARSAFHHSLNYESVVFFGRGKLVEEECKMAALKCISDHLIPKRWEEIRLPNSKEMKATKVIELFIDEASAKVRTGDPVDDKEDYALNIWAGTVPIVSHYGIAIPDAALEKNMPLPESVKNLTAKNTTPLDN